MGRLLSVKINMSAFHRVYATSYLRIYLPTICMSLSCTISEIWPVIDREPQIFHIPHVSGARVGVIDLIGFSLQSLASVDCIALMTSCVGCVMMIVSRIQLARDLGDLLAFALRRENYRVMTDAYRYERHSVVLCKTVQLPSLEVAPTAF